jgi:hypothetical protein
MCKCFLKTEKTLLNPKGGCMKKLLVVLMVLSIATIANAGLVISGAPTTMTPSGTADLSIVGSGLSNPFIDAYIVVQGPATLAGGNLDYTYGLSAWTLYTADDTYVPWMQGVMGDDTIQQVGDITFSDTTIPTTPVVGTLLDTLAIHCDGPGTVTISLVTMSDDGMSVATTWDTETILQTPEPMTMCLLGLGGLFLRRRK